MEKAIVFSATGGTGRVIVSELLSRNIPVIAFGRSENKLKNLIKEHHSTPLLTYQLGDVFDAQTISEAAKDADVIFQCANVQYHEMADKLLLLGESVMKAANISGKKIVIVDGIYVYGRQIAKGDENHPKLPHTKKRKAKSRL